MQHSNKDEAANWLNYKGDYYQQSNETESKYFCPKTGAAFKFEDLCKRLNRLLLEKKGS
jgi:hypothetical protein